VRERDKRIDGKMIDGKVPSICRGC
jgi:hypothetical protein